MSNQLNAQQFSYQAHLQLDRLLTSLQQITDHPEEHIFITTHHSLEIWFKQILFDMKRIIVHLDAGDLTQPIWLLKRIGEIMRLAEAHWVVLETMSSADFLEFRRELTGASGLQSRQFRELEVLCGLHEIAGDEYVRRVENAWPGMIEATPRTLRAAFFEAIARSGRSLAEIYRDRWRSFDLFNLAEGAIELDRRVAGWRQNHILMVRRQIGMRTRGTGGTDSRDYLAATTTHMFFPELWELRHDMAASAGGEVTA